MTTHGHANKQPPDQTAAYVHGYGDDHREFLSVRSAASEADFLLPYLRPGMRLLDCGCGQGSITVGLATAVHPGETIGIDIGQQQIAAARAAVPARAQGHLRFEQGDVLAIPFPAGSFDAVFAHTVLEHLRDPEQAMREMLRVLESGGVVGIVDPDYGTLLQTPESPRSRQLHRLLLAFAQETGSPYYARNLRQHLLAAGFVRPVSVVKAYGTRTIEDNRFAIEKIQLPTLETLRPRILEQGLADQADIDAMIADARAWAERPDGFFALLHCGAVAFKP